jgi:hypothetical protein
MTIQKIKLNKVVGIAYNFLECLIEEATWESVQNLKLCLDSIHEYERDVLHGQKLSLPSSDHQLEQLKFVMLFTCTFLDKINSMIEKMSNRCIMCAIE